MSTSRFLPRALLLSLASIACVPLLSSAGSSTSSAPASNATTVSPLADSYGKQSSGDYKAAARAMKIVADTSPQDYFSHLRLGYLQLMAADYASAAESYRQAASLSPAAVEPLLGQQQALIAIERYDAAEKVGRAILEKDPRSYLGTSRLAWTLYKLKQYPAALQLYQATLDLYPGDVDMRSGQAYTLLAMGKKDEAAAGFRAILALVPDHKGATEGLALCR